MHVSTLFHTLFWTYGTKPLWLFSTYSSILVRWWFILADFHYGKNLT